MKKKFSELHNPEISSSFKNTKIFELRNSGILVSLKIPSNVTREFYFKKKQIPEILFNNFTTTHLTRKFPF